MFHIWRAVRWWDEWQLRILVLGSLCLQWFLLLAAPMRKYTIPRCFRGCIWLAYVSSDALAIYALATLFNRHARAAAVAADVESILEVLWAPILLIHLGGQEELTAYTIEDNELWTRHTMTLVSQVAVALYAFYKSWPGSSDWRLLASAILLFIIGVASFAEKPWALNRASINRLASVSAKIQGTKEPSKWGVYLDDLVFSDWYKCFTMPRGQEAAGHWYNCFRDPSSSSSGGKGPAGKLLSEVDKVYMILSDLSLLAAADDLEQRGKASKKDVLGTLGTSARKELKRWLRGAFGFIYTRANVVVHPAYLSYHVLVAPILHVAAVVLFAASDKRRYDRTDVKTTYVLICLTAALDVLAVFIRQLIYKVMSHCPALCETVPGYNLISASVRRAHVGARCLLKCAERLGCKEEDLDCKAGQKYATYERVSTTIMGDLVGAMGRDLASYRTFPKHSDSRPSSCFTTEHDRRRPSVVGAASSDPDDERTEEIRIMISPPAASVRSNWALSKELLEMCGPEIRGSLLGSFDRSVVVWHIATDLCFRTDPRNNNKQQPPTSDAARSCSLPWCCNTATGSDDEEEEEDDDDGLLRLKMKCASSISDYMAHLLNSHPEMLLTGSRQHLVTEAMRELEHILGVMGSGGQQPSPTHVGEIIEQYSALPPRQKLVVAASKRKMLAGADDSKDVSLFHIPEACRLAKELLDIKDAEMRWQLMYRVWLGMLCYSASMCRGYLHAKSLGEGGEFLSYLWLVLSLRGARTLADKLQMPEPADGDGSELAADATSKQF